ncbi:unnamed protein product [Ectocarpus sp. 13 AM-2016]
MSNCMYCAEPVNSWSLNVCSFAASPTPLFKTKRTTERKQLRRRESKTERLGTFSLTLLRWLTPSDSPMDSSTIRLLEANNAPPTPTKKGFQIPAREQQASDPKHSPRGNKIRDSGNNPTLHRDAQPAKKLWQPSSDGTTKKEHTFPPQDLNINVSSFLPYHRLHTTPHTPRPIFKARLLDDEARAESKRCFLGKLSTRRRLQRRRSRRRHFPPENRALKKRRRGCDILCNLRHPFVKQTACHFSVEQAPLFLNPLTHRPTNLFHTLYATPNPARGAQPVREIPSHPQRAFQINRGSVCGKRAAKQEVPEESNDCLHKPSAAHKSMPYPSQLIWGCLSMVPRPRWAINPSHHPQVPGFLFYTGIGMTSAGGFTSATEQKKSVMM